MRPFQVIYGNGSAHVMSIIVPSFFLREWVTYGKGFYTLLITNTKIATMYIRHVYINFAFGTLKDVKE